MAITAYTGVPGSGKSYTVLAQVIVPAIMAGRTVRTNIEGIDPEAVREYARKKSKASENIGTVHYHEKNEWLQPSAFPTEATGDESSMVKGGDLVVIDEWGMLFEKRGKPSNPSLPEFLRYHRHFTDADGVATDVVIATQMITDINLDYRGLVERSFKFQNMKAVGLAKGYKAQVFEGSEQRKGTNFRTDNGRYKPEIFALYSTSRAEKGAHAEKKTDARATMFSKGFIGFGILALIFIVWGAMGALEFFGGGDDPQEIELYQPQRGSAGRGAPGEAAIAAQSYVPQSPYRIVGVVRADGAPLVVLADDQGTTRLENARNFEFRDDRPVSGLVDGMRVVAQDRIVLPGKTEVEY